MDRLTGEDFKFRSDIVSFCRSQQQAGVTSMRTGELETRVNANTLHKIEVLDAVLEDLMDELVVARVEQGIVFFHAKKE